MFAFIKFSKFTVHLHATRLVEKKTHNGSSIILQVLVFSVSQKNCMSVRAADDFLGLSFMLSVYGIYVCIFIFHQHT